MFYRHLSLLLASPANKRRYKWYLINKIKNKFIRNCDLSNMNKKLQKPLTKFLYSEAHILHTLCTSLVHVHIMKPKNKNQCLNIYIYILSTCTRSLSKKKSTCSFLVHLHTVCMNLKGKLIKKKLYSYQFFKINSTINK